MIDRRGLLVSAAVAALSRSVVAAPIEVTLYKSPDCTCCEGYADHLKAHGFHVSINATQRVSEISRNAGIPSELQGCHTAFVAGYVVDGHVPVEAVQRMLSEQPSIVGITLPGMPEGSPGMPGTKQEPFVVYAIGKGATSKVFMTL